MQIHDFHTKLTSANQEGHLFEALRSLSLIEDPKVMFGGEATVLGDWYVWPPMDAPASGAASAEV